MSAIVGFFANGLEHAVATWLSAYVTHGRTAAALRRIRASYNGVAGTRSVPVAPSSYGCCRRYGVHHCGLGEELMAIMTSNFWTTMAVGRISCVA